MKLLNVVILNLCFVASIHSAPIDPSKYPSPVRVACVGDSITVGVGAKPGYSYPSQLQHLLGSSWSVSNFGVSARTLLRDGDHPYWHEMAFTNAQKFQPDAVIILLGTNDTKPQNWIHNNEFKRDYMNLVNCFLNQGSKPKIYVCLPPPVPEPGHWGINETDVEKEIQIINQMAAQLNLNVIDMHTILKDSPQDFPDRVHPNNEGAFKMAAAAYQALTGKSVNIQLGTNK